MGAAAAETAMIYLWRRGSGLEVKVVKYDGSGKLEESSSFAAIRQVAVRSPEEVRISAQIVGEPLCVVVKAPKIGIRASGGLLVVEGTRP
ncbi:MAG: hypothetical protein ABWK00_05925 [Desulfurococcaceae archaeon]